MSTPRRPKPFQALLIAGAALTAAASLTASHPAGASMTHRATPCPHGRAVVSACQLIASYFDALNRGNEARACSLLGARLLLETGGSSCPSVLAMSRGTPFRIIGARSVRTTVLVRVKVGLHELDHWRMLDWVAVVGLEGSDLKILDTKRA
jgi:hypothetical protein